jgi:hypothetical protein
VFKFWSVGGSLQSLFLHLCSRNAA